MLLAARVLASASVGRAPKGAPQGMVGPQRRFYREYDAGEIAQRAYDILGVMLLDPCLYKVVVGGEHEK